MAINIALRVWLPARGGGARGVAPPGHRGASLLVVLLTSNPSGHVERRRLRRIALVLVGLLVAAALWATAFLVADLIRGKGVSQVRERAPRLGRRRVAGQQPRVCAAVLAHGRRRPARALATPIPVDFAFTQQLSPELAPPGWRPVFLDYLHLGFTNATAFSPTDVMPLTHRAKYAMLVQSTLALALFGLDRRTSRERLHLADARCGPRRAPLRDAFALRMTTLTAATQAGKTRTSDSIYDTLRIRTSAATNPAATSQRGKTPRPHPDRRRDDHEDGGQAMPAAAASAVPGRPALRAGRPGRPAARQNLGRSVPSNRLQAAFGWNPA